MITGDLTTTSSLGEFEKAREFVNALEAVGMKVFVIPGNHDQYTKRAHKDQLFYNYFPSQWEQYDLIKDGLTTQKLDKNWWLVGLDNAIATSWFCSSGYFSELGEKKLIEFLESRKADEHVILMNHFPFFPHEPLRKRLQRGNALREILVRFPQVKFYCHGHTHRHCIADLRASQLPFIMNSGCTPHRHIGFWHSLEISGNQITTEVFSWQDGKWQPLRAAQYELV